MSRYKNKNSHKKKKTKRKTAVTGSNAPPKDPMFYVLLFYQLSKIHKNASKLVEVAPEAITTLVKLFS